MAFSGLIPTTDGKIIYAKAQQGKPLHFTRVALGDGLLGGGSMVNRSALISERLSLPIDTIQLSNNEGEAAVVATLRSEAITDGFYFRELGLFAEDPDTHLDRLYLYDNAGEDGEYLSNDTESVIINERFRLLIALEGTAQVTFQGSDFPLYLSFSDMEAHNQDPDAHPGMERLRPFGPVNVTIPLSWAGTGPWTQTVAVEGVTADMELLHLSLAKNTDSAARKAQEQGLVCVTYCETVDGGLLLTCQDKKPTVALQCVLKGVE